MEFFHISKSQEEIKSRSAKINDNLNSNLKLSENLWEEKKSQPTSDVLTLMNRSNITSLLH